VGGLDPNLLTDVRAGNVGIVVVYKVDRLTRSLTDFAKLVELFDQYGVSFVSITQSFNTTSSMGRLTTRLRPRHVVPKSAQAYEPEVLVKVREWISPALASPDLVIGTQLR
jgi:Resolvase, N terminal domain